VTRALVDAVRKPVRPTQWQFRTSGCFPVTGPRRFRGTVTCDAQGAYGFPTALATTPPVGRAGSVLMTLDLPSGACRELNNPTAPATAHGLVLWRDALGRDIGRSDINANRSTCAAASSA
jgi:hypothetical protein